MMTVLAVVLALLFVVAGGTLITKSVLRSRSAAEEAVPKKSPGRVHFFTSGGQKFARVAGSLYLVQHNGWKKVEDREGR